MELDTLKMNSEWSSKQSILEFKRQQLEITKSALKATGGKLSSLN